MMRILRVQRVPGSAEGRQARGSRVERFVPPGHCSTDTPQSGGLSTEPALTRPLMRARSGAGSLPPRLDVIAIVKMQLFSSGSSKFDLESSAAAIYIRHGGRDLASGYFIRSDSLLQTFSLT